MKRLFVVGFSMLLWLFLGPGWVLQAQQAPDMILFNGKIATMDNHEVNANIGTIAQAIAIREGKVVAVGTNDQIRRLAGPNTKSLDLRGRVVTPGLASSHDHPMDWNTINPTIVKKVITDDMRIERFINASADEVMQQFPRVLDEAAQKARPGQWIRISLLYGDEYQWNDEVSALLGRQINKQMLDVAVPNNPVEVRGGFTGMVLNSNAIREVKNWYGVKDRWEEKYLYPILGDQGGGDPDADPITGLTPAGACGICYRQPEQDVIFTPEQLREVYRLGLSWTTAIGMTLFGSSFYTSGAIRAYDSLDRAGQMAMRFPYGYYWAWRNDFFEDPYFAQFVAAQVGRGSDYLWNAGATTMHGGACSELPGTSPEVKEREDYCRYDPKLPTRANQGFYKYIKAGGRLYGDHQSGDKDIDYVLDIIEQASKEAGMTLEQIRAKRHMTDHMRLYPRPDQIPRYKNLGMMAGGADSMIWTGRLQSVMRNYGERGVMQVSPRKALYDAGVMSTVEIDLPFADYMKVNYFQVFHATITRKDREGVVLGLGQAVSREAVLKSATLFGAYGSLRENVLGSLEPGKWADLIVLDKDYLTIPVDDIPKIRVLMTMVGGKPEHLAPSLAREWGIQPAGAQVELGGPAAQW